MKWKKNMSQAFGLYRWSSTNVDHERWAFGWLTGKDEDLWCIIGNLNGENGNPNIVLSPICNTPFKAFVAYLLKLLLFKLDSTMQYQFEP
jgi:hypothetical protein